MMDHALLLKLAISIYFSIGPSQMPVNSPAKQRVILPIFARKFAKIN